MSLAIQIASAIFVALVIISLMVGWCLVAWEKSKAISREQEEPYGEASMLGRDEL